MHSALCPLTPIGSPFSAGGPLIPKKGLRRPRVSRRHVGAVVEKPGVFNVKVSVFTSVADTKYAHKKLPKCWNLCLTSNFAVRKYHPILTITHVSRERKTTLLLISPKNPSPPTFGIYEILVKIHGRILPTGSTGLVYIYLHENHKKSTIHVGKYTNRPMDLLWV